eukprot:947442_1
MGMGNIAGYGGGSGLGSIYGQQQQQQQQQQGGFPSTNTLDMDKHGKMTNLESVDQELSIEDAFQLMKMMGPQDPFNVRRLLINDYQYDYAESSDDSNSYYKTYDAISDEDRSISNAISNNYGDIVNNNNQGYDFDKEFEYGDMLGYTLWGENKIGDDETLFKCLNCNYPPNFSAIEIDENNIEMNENNNNAIEENEYDIYGDFMYYFDEHLFNFNNDKHWY